MTAARSLVLACLLVLAGCSTPLGPEPTASPTPTAAAFQPTASPTPTGTDLRGGSPTEGSSRGNTSTTVATPGALPPPDALPPGVARTGIDNATELLRAHVGTFEHTGFVVLGNGSGTVRRGAFLVEVRSIQRNRVAANASAYRVRRSLDAGPFQREVTAWSNGSVEYVRTREDGATNYSTASSRSLARLAGRGILAPHLRGGAFSPNGTVNGTGNGSSVVLVASSIANETEIRRAIAPDAEQVTGYRARLVVDPNGRVRSLDAAVEYVISGQNATHRLTYEVERSGAVTIRRPDWLDEGAVSANETA